MWFKLPELKYSYDALEPYIDTKTMEIHHKWHHQTYVDKLNSAIEWTEYENWDIEELLTNLDSIDENKRKAVRNHGWWYYNHNIFWEFMTPEKTTIDNDLLDDIKDTFWSFDKFKEEFENAALTHFWSGWAFLVKDENNNLKVYSLPNQDTPITYGHKTLLLLDMWEHSYYLKHQNKKAWYVKDFWNVVNWDKVNELYKS